jgi:hypothetical protein
MIDYIRYTIDNKSYSLINNGDGTWSTPLNAPSVAGIYTLLLEIGEDDIKTYIDSSDSRYNFYLEVIEEIERKVDLIKYIPNFMQNSVVFKALFDAENAEIDLLYDNIRKASLDVFIRTASIEQITRLESFLRIKGIGTLDQRRSYLLSLKQRGKKLNEKTIKEVTNIIAGADCIVTFFSADEHDNPNPGYGVLKIQVLSPDNKKDYRYDDIQRALKNLVPSHIKLIIIKYFSLWDDIRLNYADWNSVATMADWSAIKNYLPPQ